MRHLPLELLIAFALLLCITGLYAWMAQAGLPAPGGGVGHALGIVGFLLMLTTEFAYTLRKRVHGLAWGNMRIWLSVHVVTGIVGPYLVLLHSAGRFQGLAGLVSLLTITMVISGFIGRYIYTAVPRNLDGAEMGEQGLASSLVRVEDDLVRIGVTRLESMTATATQLPPLGWRVVFGGRWLERRYGEQVRSLTGRLKPRELALKAEELLTERYSLWLQVHRLLATRRMLALWHLFHVPLGAVLFSLAFLHVGAALYYSTFLK